MASVRNELALANAQELINVRQASFLYVFRPIPTITPRVASRPRPPRHTENKREMLRKVRDQAIDVTI
jgi:hypothetical protein